MTNRFYFFYYFTANIVWKRFQDMFAVIGGLFDYVPIYKAIKWRMLEELYEDNVMYAEIRSGLSPVRSFMNIN